MGATLTDFTFVTFLIKLLKKGGKGGEVGTSARAPVSPPFPAFFGRQRQQLRGGDDSPFNLHIDDEYHKNATIQLLGNS